VGTTNGLQGQSIDVLSINCPNPELGMPVTVHLAVHDRDELRGALRPDDSGRARRGDLNALRRLEEQQ
jgi:hypothetical protein